MKPEVAEHRSSPLVDQEAERRRLTGQTPALGIVEFAEAGVVCNVAAGNALLRKGGLPPAIGGGDVAVVQAAGIGIVK